MNLKSIAAGKTWRFAAVAVTGASIVAISSTGVFATLNASTNNVNAQRVVAGTLKLTMANAKSSAGFNQTIDNLAVGDVVNRYVDLKNSGSLDSKALTLAIATSTDSTPSLVTDAIGGGTNKAITVGVKSCTVAWAADGTCADAAGAKVEIATTTLSTFAAAHALATTKMTAGQTLFLQIQATLPDQNETTVNGVLPANTVQGGSAGLTYTFFQSQRDASVSNS